MFMMSLRHLLIDVVVKFALAMYSEHFCLSVPERRITDTFTIAQHLLNMAGVSKRWQKKHNKIVVSSKVAVPTLDNIKTA